MSIKELSLEDKIKFNLVELKKMRKAKNKLK